MKDTRILIIDDEPDFSALLAANLEEAGNFEVRELNDSSRSVEVAREFEPDLCVIDVVMPGMDGGDVVARFREDPELRSIPVVMLTALVEENPNRPDGETITGGLPFISKTSDFETVLASIEKHLLEAEE